MMNVLHNPLPKDGDKSFAFPPQCIMLKIVGAWPLMEPSDQTFSLMDIGSNNKQVVGWLYLGWSHTIIILIALTCWAQSSFVFLAWGDILTVTECGCTVLMGIHNLLRLIHLSIRRKALKKLNTDFAQNIWISRKREKLVAEQCERDTFILKMISGMLFVLICMYVIVPLFELFTDPNSKTKPFPYKMVFPYNANNGALYVITYFLTSLAGFGVVTTLFAEDSLFGFFVAYICGQFNLLHRDIERIMKTAQLNAIRNSRNSGPILESDVHRECSLLLRNIIKRHSVIIRFCDLLEEFFSPILLINFTISSFLICMVVLQIAAVRMTIGNLAKLLIYIVSAMSQLFILCWKGNRLIESSTETAWKLYSCNWQGINSNSISLSSSAETESNNNHQRYGNLRHVMGCSGGISFTKDLAFGILRAQKPLCITALKFSILSLKSFTTILSTSLSYFTLLKTLVEKSE